MSRAIKIICTIQPWLNLHFQTGKTFNNSQNCNKNTAQGKSIHKKKEGSFVIFARNIL